MASHHWVAIGLTAVVFYLVGAKYPSLAGKVGL